MGVLNMGATKCRYRGEEYDIADALMILTKDELAEAEVTLEGGTLIRAFRDFDPEFRTDKNGFPCF
jgi:hypothetical protein